MTTSTTIGKFLIGAAVIGAAVGYGSLATSPEGRNQINTLMTSVAEGADEVAVAAGIARARAPQPGDYWGGCNDARAAGTAPIYFGEPGYRKGMDGDGDGVACEPHY